MHKQIHTYTEIETMLDEKEIRQIEELIHKGFTADQIAEKLIISTPTVFKYARVFGITDKLRQNTRDYLRRKREEKERSKKWE